MERSVEIPEGVNVEVDGKRVKVSGEKGELERNFNHPLIKVEKKDSTVVFSSDVERKKVKALLGTYEAHLKNMIRGVTEGFEYKLKIVYVHFPMNVSVSGNEVVIRNYLGEKAPRKAKILDGVTVKVEGEDVIVSGIDKEKVGQTAANIENVAKPPTGKDRRKFIDGIFIVEKPKVKL
ncbi:MAG: 50S ribosomal protein L6 [Candidatus Aenigmatarchaeota archaeon]|nr:MAG: 50S ribosomal protein L6 [Candidatus Aenigmarchaeota archaeon]